jgi:hypothetical protein
MFTHALTILHLLGPGHAEANDELKEDWTADVIEIYIPFVARSFAPDRDSEELIAKLREAYDYLPWHKTFEDFLEDNKKMLSDLNIDLAALGKQNIAMDSTQLQTLHRRVQTNYLSLLLRSFKIEKTVEDSDRKKMLDSITVDSTLKSYISTKGAANGDIIRALALGVGAFATYRYGSALQGLELVVTGMLSWFSAWSAQVFVSRIKKIETWKTKLDDRQTALSTVKFDAQMEMIAKVTENINLPENITRADGTLCQLKEASAAINKTLTSRCAAVGIATNSLSSMALIAAANCGF